MEAQVVTKHFLGRAFDRESTPDSGKSSRGPCHARCPFDQPLGLQREHHLMHGRRSNPEVSFHVGHRWRSPIDLCVVINRG